MDEAGLILTGVGVLMTIFTIVFLGGRWVGGVNQRLDHHSAILDHHSAILEEHSAALDQINTLLDQIRRDIRKLFNRLPPDTVDDDSPLRLTELGEQIARQLDARTWAALTAEQLRDRVSGMRPYQIQEFCFNYVYDFEPDPRMKDGIGDAAYENGIDDIQVLRALALVLRDELLQDTA